MSDTDEVEYVGRFTNIRKKGNVLYFPDKEGKTWYELCEEVDIEKRSMNLITGEVKTHLRYWLNNEYHSIVIDRKDFTKNGLVGVLPARGIQITEASAGLLLDYLLYREKRTRIQFIHDRVGFFVINGERCYLHDQAYSKSGVIKSSYCGNLEISPKGSVDGELKLVKDEVLGWIPLECAWTLGFAAPILCLLRDMIALDNCIIHSYGASSSGKSTSSLLSISMFGMPSKNCSSGLYGSWASTANALVGRAAHIMGVPMVFDEAGILDRRVYGKIIYQFSQGLDKTRLTADSTLREKARFSSLFISNGENALLNDSNRNNGLKVRVLQFANVVWTKDSRNSTQITERLMDNYGNSGCHFVKSILKYSDDDLLLQFKEAKEHVMKSLVKIDNFSSRSSDKIAVIYLTAKLINKVFGIGLDEEGILRFLIKADESQVECRNLGYQAYTAVKESITSNMNKFVFKDNSLGHQIFSAQSDYAELPRNEIIGRIITDSSKVPTEAWILRSKLDKILSQAGFADADVVLSEWRDKGIIDTDKQKFTRKRSLYHNGDTVRVVILKLNGTEYDALDVEIDDTAEAIRTLRGIHVRETLEEVVEEDII
ncbi:DUF927 domain-containing protein [Proteiniclasticum sp. C24MP]|uniref:DUF927 domain-containing protein n=1 Tax=Proteiniclasticum sp. C24MP TaxID=3374101 RepID=UPI00375401DF